MENNETTNVEFTSPPSGGASRSERQWAMACHLAGLTGILVPYPFIGVVATLVLWLIKREDGELINDQGKEALNFQITLVIYASICIFLATIVIGLLLIIPLALFAFISMVVAAVKANEGTAFRYPACIRFIK